MIDEEIIELDMVFAVCPQNMHSISKVITLLGKIRVIMAVVPKETPRQFTQCGEYVEG